MNLFRRLYRFLARPSARFSAATLMAGGLIFGLAVFGSGYAVVAGTSSMEFCVSCHSMHDNVYQEYKESVHYSNASGVRATCSDCHVPKEFGPLIKAKIIAAKDVWHEILGTIDTPEKFEARRWEMANRVWAFMESSNSSTCRSCHDFTSMNLSEQDRMARRKHDRAEEEGKSCIECHKSLVHKKPRRPDENDTASR